MQLKRRPMLAPLIILVILFGSSVAEAACTVPNLLTNGQATDATQVMANFNAVTSCVDGNGKVNSGTSGQIGYYGSAGPTISGENLSDLLDSSVSPAQGTLLYRGAAGWTALAPGAAGQLLRSGGPSADPAWSPGSTALGVAPFFGPTGGTWTRPAGISFTWVNQGSATSTDNPNGGPLVFSKPAASSNSISLLCVPAPAAPFTYTSMISVPAFGSVDYTAFGIALYDSGSGKITTLGFANNAVNVLRFTNFSTFNVSRKNLAWSGSLMWMRVTDDGINLTFYISTDGIVWLQFYTETVASYMPAITGVCWGGNPNDNNVSGLPTYTELWQWTPS